MKQKSQAQPSWLSTAKYMMNAGATPKLTASTSESSSTPNRLTVRVMRATRPSRASMRPLSTMHQPDQSKWPRYAETIANTPKKRFPSVKPFGSRTIARRMLGRGISLISLELRQHRRAGHREIAHVNLHRRILRDVHI